MDPVQKGPFKFNLLPPKSKTEVVLEVERDDSVLYSMLLVFVAGLAFFGVTMINTLFVVPRVKEFEKSVVNRQQQIALFNDIRTKNGELYVKTRTLSPVLDKRIDSSEIFRVADQIDLNTVVQVESYGREKSGLFIFQVSTRTIDQVTSVISDVNKITGVSEVFFRSSRYRENKNNYLTTLAVRIDAI
jgi:hypothetical protein